MFPLHDRSYKRLFSHPRLFRQLLEHFVDEPWVKALDFEHCAKMEKSFISEHYKSTESDLLYQVKIHGQEAYIYILLEFQSTVTWFMAVRFLHYISSFWLDYAESHPKHPKLPAVFPLLLYSGDKRWTAQTDLTKLLEHPDLFPSYTPQFRYFKIAENEYSPEHLLKIRNLVSTLFLAETHYDVELLQSELLKLFEREEDQKAVSLLVNWFKQLVVHKRGDPLDYDALERVYKDKEEAKQMLETAIAKERERIFAQGKAEGQVEGRADLLISLLERRFKPLTPAQKQHLYELDATKLLTLAEQMWHAQSLQAVLNENPGATPESSIQD